MRSYNGKLPYFKAFYYLVSTVADIKINEEFKEKNKDKECFCLDNLIDPENEENQKIQQIKECKVFIYYIKIFRNLKIFLA